MAAAKAMIENEQAPLCVTFGVTYGKHGYASASLPMDQETEPAHLGSRRKLDGAAQAKMGLRGNHLSRPQASDT